MTMPPPATYPEPGPPIPAPVPPPPGPPPLRGSTQIQGNVLAAFNKDFTTFLLVSFPADIEKARSWIGALLPLLADSVTKHVEDWNEQFSVARAAAGGQDPPNLTTHWLNLGITLSGLNHLADPAVITAGLAPYVSFVQGLPSVAPGLGDVGTSDPAQWMFGNSTTAEVHAVVTIAADLAADLAAQVQFVEAEAATAGVTILTALSGATLSGSLKGHEHFGFKDGISQPGVQQFHQPDPANQAVRQGHPGQTLIPPGEFVLGYPRANGTTDATAWLKDSSFQVLRQLEQDVPAWWGQASGLALGQALPLDDAGAKLMGRSRDGTALAAPAGGPDGNDFDYSTDAQGTITPCLAHIRKTNPRSFADNTHRMMRRGIPFGPPFDLADHGPLGASRGLLFNAYCGDLTRQFEFVQASWANAAAFGPEGPTGPDPVISPGGQAAYGTASLTFGRFVKTLGGVYALCLGLSTLEVLVAGQPLLP